MYWDHILEPRLTVEADQETAYPVTVDGDEYLQQIFTVTSETWVDGYRTGELGEILLTDLQPGTYLVQEVAVDDKHVLDGTPQQVELHAGDGIKPLIFYNARKPGIHLIKVDASDPSKVISDAKFSIRSVAGDYGPEEFVTDDNGEIDLSKLPVGAYVVTELSCPGYIVDEAQRIIQLDGNENAEFIFKEPLKKAHIKRHEGKGRRNRPEFSQFLRPNAGFCPVF